MVGEKVVLRTRMSAGDAHYAGELVEGAHIVTAWGDVGTELAIRLFGDESLFLGYSEVRYTHPVYSGDFMEYSGWIEKVGNTSLTCHFEAHKVIELILPLTFCPSPSSALMAPALWSSRSSISALSSLIPSSRIIDHLIASSLLPVSNR